MCCTCAAAVCWHTQARSAGGEECNSCSLWTPSESRGIVAGRTAARPVVERPSVGVWGVSRFAAAYTALIMLSLWLSGFRRRWMKHLRPGACACRGDMLEGLGGLRWVASKTCASKGGGNSVGSTREGGNSKGQLLNLCCDSGFACPGPSQVNPVLQPELTSPPVCDAFSTHRWGPWMADSDTSQRTRPVAPAFVESGAWRAMLHLESPISTNIDGNRYNALRGVRICPPWPQAAVGGSGLMGGPALRRGGGRLGLHLTGAGTSKPFVAVQPPELTPSSCPPS